LPELFEAAACLRVRVERARDDLRDPGLEDGLRAWRRDAEAATGFERDVERGALRSVACRLQRDHFGVRFTLPLVPALADHLAVADDDRPDDRVRVGRAPAPLGELQRPFEAHVSTASSR
jgi:hypothetical protein